MDEKHRLAAHGAAAHNAYRVVEEFGLHDGTEMLRTISGAYLLALAAVIGWPSVFQFIQHLMAGYVPPGKRKKLYPLRVIKGGKQ